MYVLIFILLLLSLFVFLLFYKPVNVKLKLNTNDEEICLLFNWLDSLVKAEVKINNSTSVLSVFLYKARIYSKPVTIKGIQRKSSVLDYYRVLTLDRMYAKISYGLADPFYTGIISGILQYIKYSLQNVLLTQYPNFIPEKEYLFINAGAQLNIGKTIMEFLRLKQTKKFVRSN